jgi:hypothetical protein
LTNGSYIIKLITQHLSIKLVALCFFLFYGNSLSAQVVGGTRALEYLRLPNGPRVSALGGINVVNPETDIVFALQNPSLMRPGLHNKLALNINAFYSGITISNLLYGYHVPELKTSFALGLQYLGYGNLIRTDELGNAQGEFKASDFTFSIAAGRQYRTYWRYGATLKWAQSNLEAGFANALLTDVGVTYNDTSTKWTFAAVAKNMGVMLQKYTAANGSEPLPFDLQLGVSKRFRHIPLRLMGNFHHLYQWDIRYDNPDDLEGSNLFGNQDSAAKPKSHFADKLLRHVIFGAELTIAKRLTMSTAFNYLKRSELVIRDKTGMAGFSFGVHVNLNKFQVQYARSFYHIAGAYNEFGLCMSLNKLFNTGKFGEKYHWSAAYPDWN